MIVKLFKYTKKINSTADPINEGVTGLEVTGKILNNCSIITPLLELEYGGVNNVQEYNYVQIPQFKRFYFVTNATFNNSKWLLSLQVDVLASFRDSIMGTQQYVLRSTYLYNDMLIDDAYPTYIDSDNRYGHSQIMNIAQYNKHTDSWIIENFYNLSYSQGYYVLGLYSNNESGVTWYRFSAAAFRDFISVAMAYEPADMLASNIPNGYAKAIFDVTQYIVSCYWYPFQIRNITTSGGNIRRFNLGGYTIDMGYSDTGVYQIDTSGTEIFRSDRFTFPSHPDASSYPYLNLSPYTELGVYFPPFGFIPVDSSKVFTGDVAEVRCRFYVDVTSGQGIFRIENAQYDNAIIVERNCSVGIPIPISNMTLSDTGALVVGSMALGEYLAKSVTKSSTVSNAVNKMENFATNVANAISEDKLGIVPQSVQDYFSNLLNQPSNLDLKGTILDATAITFGQLNTKGSPGSNLYYNIGTPYSYAWFYKEVGHDDDRFGRPCRKLLSLSSFSNGGYIVCANSSMNYHGVNDAYPTMTELHNILNYLNTGVFLASTH